MKKEPLPRLHSIDEFDDWRIALKAIKITRRFLLLEEMVMVLVMCVLLIAIYGVVLWLAEDCACLPGLGMSGMSWLLAAGAGLLALGGMVYCMPVDEIGLECCDAGLKIGQNEFWPWAALDVHWRLRNCLGGLTRSTHDIHAGEAWVKTPGSPLMKFRLLQMDASETAEAMAALQRCRDAGVFDVADGAFPWEESQGKSRCWSWNRMRGAVRRPQSSPEPLGSLRRGLACMALTLFAGMAMVLVLSEIGSGLSDWLIVSAMMAVICIGVAATVVTSSCDKVVFDGAGLTSKTHGRLAWCDVARVSTTRSSKSLRVFLHFHDPARQRIQWSWPAGLDFGGAADFAALCEQAICRLGRRS
ncbi:hypothetical protein [Chromobacterium violaceum]|uniref:hypothetical protein n=1 Tax=Chromobacterium violaceum TaxID=536 RepID=UPI001B31B31F|nr:hypothetical protein [Chromobacterium violaceum]MBP4046421.1 hypothetical protein [Chromobacterium violaceum]